MQGFNLTCIICATVAIFLLVPPKPSTAEDLTFVPTIVESTADLEFDGTVQTSDYTQGNTENKATGTLFREKLNYLMNGFVYHPGFEIFLVRLTPTLNEWSIKGSQGGTLISSGESNNQSTIGSFDYELRTIFLPTHFYNLELFATRTELAAPGTFWQGLSGAVREEGATFKFKEKPYYLAASYDDISLDSSLNQTDTKSYLVNAGYSIPQLSNSAGYSHAVSTGVLDSTENTRDNSYFANTIRLSDFILDSRINDATSDQTMSGGPEFQQRTLFWTEQLTAPLPWNFLATGYFSYQDIDQQTTEPASLGASNTDVTNRSTNSSFGLTNHLYQSLVTTFTYNYLSTTSPSGELSAWSDQFNSIYTKNIPAGRITVGVQYGTGVTDRQGVPQILNEIHNAALNQSFTLTVQYITEGSITVQVKDPVTGILVTLPPGGYIVTVTGTSTQIVVISVSPATLEPNPAYVYEFHVSYSLSNSSKISLTNKGYNLKADLLNNLLSLYYNYLTSDQDVVSGSIPGGTDHLTNQIEGLMVYDGHYTGTIEHQSFQSLLNPTETWRTKGEYRAPLTNNINVSALVSYVWTDYLAVPELEQAGRIDKTTGVDLRMDMKIPDTHLTVFVSGSYYNERSLVESDIYYLNSYVTWHLGLLSVNIGAQVSDTESTFSTIRTKLMSENYYFTLSRKLF